MRSRQTRSEKLPQHVGACRIDSVGISQEMDLRGIRHWYSLTVRTSANSGWPQSIRPFGRWGGERGGSRIRSALLNSFIMADGDDPSTLIGIDRRFFGQVIRALSCSAVAFGPLPAFSRFRLF